MDAKLGDTVAHRFHVAKQTSFKPLDPSDHNATNRGVCQMVEPRGELRECFDTEHNRSVIERLHIVKTTYYGMSGPKVGTRVNLGARSFAALNRPVGSVGKWPGIPATNVC